MKDFSVLLTGMDRRHIAILRRTKTHTLLQEFAWRKWNRTTIRGYFHLWFFCMATLLLREGHLVGSGASLHSYWLLSRRTSFLDLA